jgi:hypothetical protein
MTEWLGYAEDTMMTLGITSKEEEQRTPRNILLVG